MTILDQSLNDQLVIMDIERIRKETPGVQNVIHFNNAGSSLVPKSVYNVVTNYLETEFQNGGYETADKFHSALEETYYSIASLIGAKTQEIAYKDNATAAWQAAFSCIKFNPGDIILSNTLEYASNYIPFLQWEKKLGIKVQVIKENEHGEVSLDDLEQKLNEKVKLVSITHIPTSGGLTQPAESVGEIVSNSNAYYLLDACQSIGQYPLNIKKLKCDFLSATGRKYLRAPRGTGFLFVNENILDELEPLLLDLHGAEWISKYEYKVRDDARKFENWEANCAAKLGLNEAAKYASNIGIDNIWDRVKKLGEVFRKKLNDTRGIVVHDLGRIQSGIVTFSHPNLDTSELKKALHDRKINVSVAQKSGTFLDLNQRKIDYMIRASVHYYNTEEEIDSFLNTLEELINRS